MKSNGSQTQLLSIGEVAALAGVATSVLRYYERVKLLKPAGRSNAGYRHYSSDDVARLRFIRATQSIGFTLQDIRALLRIDGASAKSCRAEVQELIDARVREIDAKMSELRRMRSALTDVLRLCKCSRSDRCNVLACFREKCDES
jgi:DNA-binding transcriptional MerR regulator